MGDTSRCHSAKIANTYIDSNMDKATKAQVALFASGKRSKPLLVLTLAQLMQRYPKVATAALRWARFSDWYGRPENMYRPCGQARTLQLLISAWKVAPKRLWQR